MHQETQSAATGGSQRKSSIGLVMKDHKSHGTGLKTLVASHKGPYSSVIPTRTPSVASSQASCKDEQDEKNVAEQMESMLREKFGTLKHEEEEEKQRRMLKAKKEQQETAVQVLVETTLSDTLPPPLPTDSHMEVFHQAFSQRKTTGQLQVSPVGLAKLREKADIIMVWPSCV
jgi:hypothetical protein